MVCGFCVLTSNYGYVYTMTKSHKSFIMRLVWLLIVVKLRGCLQISMDVSRKRMEVKDRSGINCSTDDAYWVVFIVVNCSIFTNNKYYLQKSVRIFVYFNYFL